jgi:hypothetical protein
MPRLTLPASHTKRDCITVLQRQNQTWQMVKIAWGRCMPHHILLQSPRLSCPGSLGMLDMHHDGCAS